MVVSILVPTLCVGTRWTDALCPCTATGPGHHVPMVGGHPVRSHAERGNENYGRSTVCRHLGNEARNIRP